MATARRTVRVELDERLVSRARAQARDDSRPDDEIIEDALSRYLLERLLDKTGQRSNLSEEEATRLAVEELHAMRRGRDARCLTRAVVDSGVLVSALIGRRDAPPSQVLRAWARGRFELVVSPKLISEVAGVLARPKFERYLRPDEASDFLDMLRSDAVVHPDPAVVERVTRDPG